MAAPVSISRSMRRSWTYHRFVCALLGIEDWLFDCLEIISYWWIYVRSRNEAKPPLSVDLLDRDSIMDAVAGSEAIFHFATAIPPQDRMSKPKAWVTNDRLRGEATSHLVDAGLRHGVQAFVQE